ncbi:MAG: hypothetical protein BGO82_12955 [Devosia sp. 67-54]|nr:MAG: hypothetical protein BGO82_12955 [Devosia sp. 67-54]
MIRQVVGAVLVMAALLGASHPAAAKGLGAIYAPAPYSLLEEFFIGDNGAVRMVRKEHNGRWRQPYDITPPNWGIPDSPVTAIWSVQNDQLEIFWADGAGAISLIWTDHDHWHAPVKISPAGYVAPGAQLSGVWQTGEHEMELFGIDARGALKMLWKKDNGKWQTSADMSVPNYAVPGGPVSAVFQPAGRCPEVFTIGLDGAINVVWKCADNPWAASPPLTAPGVADPHAQLTSTYYDKATNLIEVFWIDQKGAMHALWSYPGGKWVHDTISAPGIAPPGSSVSAVYQPLHDHLEVFGITPKGGVFVEWRSVQSRWTGPQTIVKDGTLPLDATLRGVFQPENNQLEVFYLDAVGQLWDVFKANDSGWSVPPVKLTDVAGASLLKAGDCSVYFHKWSNGKIAPDDYMTSECARVTGITAYCDAQDAFIAQDLYGPQGNKKRLICVPYSRPDSIGEQAAHIVRGVEQGLSDALIAAAPYLGPATEGVSCINGVLFACAALALDVVDIVAGNKIPQDVKLFADQAISCAGGGYVECASLGERSIEKLSGVKIPASDVVQVLSDVSDCKNRIYAACARLGQQAASAAGLPPDFLPSNVASVLSSGQKCLIEEDSEATPEEQKENTVDSCRDLGLSLATAAGVNQNVVDATKNGIDCANGDENACKQLGLAAARALVPAALTKASDQYGLRCINGDAASCYPIAIAAVDAAGLPTGDIGAMHACANGDMATCQKLVTKMTGLPVGTGLETVQAVSRCSDGDAQACIDLAKSAVSKYDRTTGTMVTDNLLGVTGKGLAKRLSVARTVGFSDWVTKSPAPASAAANDIPTAPSPAAAADFGGNWSTQVQNGTVYPMTLTQDGAGHVTGSYPDGTISDGVVVDYTLYAHWQQGAANGLLQFNIVQNGQSFAGFWARADHATNGTWIGTRQQPAARTQVPVSTTEQQQLKQQASQTPQAETQQKSPQAQQKAPPVELIKPAPPVVVTPPPKQIVLPQGQCPANVASATQQLQILAGRLGDPIGKIAAGTRLQCLACDQSWCLIGSNNPNSTVPRQQLRFEMPQPVKPTPAPEAQQQIKPTPPLPQLQIKKPVEPTPPQQAKAPVQPKPEPKPEPKPASEPAPAPEVANFDGHWNVFTSTGLVEQFELHQQGVVVVGGFTDTYGTSAQVNGAVSGRTLTLQWANNRGYTGVGTFTMHDDKQSFDGRFGVNTIPPFQQISNYANGGTWQTFVPEQASPDDLTMYGGCSSCNDAPSNVVK